MGLGSGSVAVYRYQGGWALEDTIVPADGVAFDVFGSSVALWGDTLAIGAPTFPVVVNKPGKVYLYERDALHQWNLEQVVSPADGVENDLFGIAVDIQDDLLVAGANGRDSAHTFVRETSGQWREHLAISLSQTDVIVFDGESTWLGNSTESLGAGSAFEFAVSRDLTIASPSTVQAGDTLTITTSLGQPGGTMFLFAVGVNGTPLFLRLVQGNFDANGIAEFSLGILPGLEGITLDIVSLFRDANEKLVLTDPATIAFE